MLKCEWVISFHDTLGNQYILVITDSTEKEAISLAKKWTNSENAKVFKLNTIF